MAEPQHKYAKVEDKDGEISRLSALLAAHHAESRTPTDEALTFGTVKKPATQVGGEVFHQLHLTRLSGPRQSYGLLATWNKWQLVSSAPFDHDAIQNIQLPCLEKPEVNSDKSSPPPRMGPDFQLANKTIRSKRSCRD
jgi:hypothetical protein